MRKSLVWMAVLGLVLGSTVLAYGVGGAMRGDCPGKITCPLTGEEVCKDQCPLVDASRPDCPGKVECPLTGDLVCKDRCPVGKNAARPDCPGQIECPLTGELVCKDECPLGQADETAKAVPACCEAK
jgi:hypothetical protein